MNPKPFGTFENCCINGKYYTLPELEIFLENCQNKELVEAIKKWINPLEYYSIKTSGSTGNPKIIKHLKERMLYSVNSSASYFKWKKNDKIMLAISPSYIGGVMIIARALLLHLDLVIADLSLNPFLNSNIKNKIQFVSLVPSQVKTILKNDKSRKEIRKVKQVLIGGGTIDEEIKELIANEPNEYFASFGMTETISHFAIQRLNGRRKQDHFEIINESKIAVNENQCLVIRDPNLSENEIVTNDLIEIIDQRSFRWLGRNDFVINSGGIKLHPEQIENIIAPLIPFPFFISSEKDDILNEKVVLYIEVDPVENLSFMKKSDLLLKEIEKCLPKYHSPKKIIFTDHFKRTDTNKIIRILPNQIINY